MLFLVSGLYGEDNKKEPIDWQPWSNAVYEIAKKEKKFVLLDLGAVWCHWCHVMHKETYQNPEVVRLLKDKYIAVRVDQDSRPDLANKYEDYGWPATIIFAADGSEIVKRRGYIAPDDMASLLQAVIDDPTPGPSVTSTKSAVVAAGTQSSLLPEYVVRLKERITGAYDPLNKGWGEGGQKFLDWYVVEHCMDEARAGNKVLETMARETLRAQSQLIDPVWGGVYQYSTDGDWKHPHYEKLTQFQAENLRIYSLAWAQWKDPLDLAAADKIRAYMVAFLTSPEGAFYTSQDADMVRGEHSADYFALDDAGRRRLGIPRVDKQIYARENGWAIQAMVAHYAATGNRDSLERAIRAAKWIEAHRSLADGGSGGNDVSGGFRHGEQDAAGPYLGDTLSMGRAFLALHVATAEPEWLLKAQAAADFIERNFRSTNAYVTARAKTAASSSAPQWEENVDLVRFCNLLHRYTGKPAYREMAEHAMRYMAVPAVSEDKGYRVAGLLLAAQELATEPVHITIVGSKADPVAQALYSAALALPGGYRLLEWRDPASDRAATATNAASISFPALDKPAAFICANGSCSAPAFSVDQLHKALQRKAR